MCLGGAEVEIGGVVHRPSNPCYHTPSTPKTGDGIREELAGAVARGWCSKENEEKLMDGELVFAIVDQVIPLIRSLHHKQMESVKEVIESVMGKEGSMSGTFGYQGIEMGITAFQTEVDTKRDKVLSILNKRI